MVSNVAAGLVGDILVTQFDVSLTVLFYISAVAVCAGMIAGKWYNLGMQIFSKEKNEQMLCSVIFLLFFTR